MSETEKTTTYQNQGVQQTGILQIRLDVASLLESIELYLSGKQKRITLDTSGNILEEIKPVGHAKANVEGIQGIMSFFSSIINTQVVQGNYKEEWYFDYIGQSRQNLALMIFNNQARWDISDEDFEPICEFCMNIVEPFMSRTLNDGERKSYQSYEITENRSSETKGNKVFPFTG